MDSLLSNLSERSPGSRRAILVIAVVASLSVAVAVGLLAPAFSPYAGGVAGLVLFVATVATFHTELSEQSRQRWDLRAAWPIRQRRIVAGCAIAVWAVALLLLSSNAAPPGYVGGTLTVWLVVGLAYFIRASPQERAEALAAWEEAQAAAEAAADEEAYDAADDDYAADADADYSHPHVAQARPGAPGAVAPHSNGAAPVNTGLAEFSGEVPHN